MFRFLLIFSHGCLFFSTCLVHFKNRNWTLCIKIKWALYNLSCLLRGFILPAARQVQWWLFSQTHVGHVEFSLHCDQAPRSPSDVYLWYMPLVLTRTSCNLPHISPCCVLAYNLVCGDNNAFFFLMVSTFFLTFHTMCQISWGQKLLCA